MMINGLSDKLSLHEEQRTTIEQGFIVRENIWKDNRGREWERIQLYPPKFRLKKKPDYDTTEIMSAPPFELMVMVVTVLIMLVILYFWYRHLIRIFQGLKTRKTSSPKTEIPLPI